MATIKSFTDTELRILDIRVRNMLVAVACNGHRYKDIAAEHGVPVGTVKSRISRARAKITKMRVEIVTGLKVGAPAYQPRKIAP